jgi:hypothetical protein
MVRADSFPALSAGPLCPRIGLDPQRSFNIGLRQPRPDPGPNYLEPSFAPPQGPWNGPGCFRMRPIGRLLQMTR